MTRGLSVAGLLACLATFGCDAPRPQGDQWVQGVFLRARGVGAGDELAEADVFDGRLGQACRFRVAADGALRCLPGADHLRSSAFADEACAQPALAPASELCDRTGTVQRTVDLAGCATRTTVLQRDAGEDLRPGYATSDVVGCDQRAPDAGPVAALHAVPPAAFVLATVRREARAHVALETLVSEDGLTLPWRLFDVANDTPCAPRPLGGKVVCAPLAPLRALDFADGACRLPAFPVVPECAGARFGTASGCGAEFFALGAVQKTRSMKSGTNCDLVLGPQPEVVAAGAALSPDRLPVAQVGYRGRGRLQRRVLTWPGGLSWGDALVDTRLGFDCVTSLTAADGSRRCLPTLLQGTLSPAFFTDPGCSAPLVQWSGCEPSPPKYVSVHTGQSCGNRLVARVYALGPAHSGKTFLSGAQGCVELAGVAGFVRGAEVPPSELAELTVEP